jgi:lysophospholipase L1-like esterase
MLINSGTGKTPDIGTLNTTLHHNWWDGSDTRNPRCGYGKIHVFNNLYNNNDYCIGLHSGTRVIVEKNYFFNTNDPIHQMYQDDPDHVDHGFAEAVDNVCNNCTGDWDAEGVSFPVDDYYMYSFMLNDPNDVQSIVQAGAGPSSEYETIGLMPIPGQGAIGVDNPTLKWLTGTESPSSYIVYFGTTTNPPQVATTTSESYDVGSLEEGVIYYWRVDQVTSEGTIPGKLWTFKAKGTSGTTETSCAPVTIMPLGDSITYGTGAATGYRGDLYKSLRNGGYDVDFVGGETGNSEELTDPDHEGHSGWRADQIRDSVYSWLDAHPAEVVLLHIGTNDIRKGQGAEGTADEIGQILDNIDSWEKAAGVDVWVILARIVNRSDHTSSLGQETTALNNQIQSLADKRITAGDNIIVVDMESALNYPGDLDDRLHPNESGYSKMAGVWYNTLNSFLPEYCSDDST